MRYILAAAIAAASFASSPALSEVYVLDFELNLAKQGDTFRQVVTFDQIAPKGGDTLTFRFTIPNGGEFDLDAQRIQIVRLITPRQGGQNAPVASGSFTFRDLQGNTVAQAGQSLPCDCLLVVDDFLNETRQVRFGRLDVDLTFAADDPNSYTQADLSFGQVPEPATWAMMIAGFGLAGGVARRKRFIKAYS